MEKDDRNPGPPEDTTTYRVQKAVAGCPDDRAWIYRRFTPLMLKHARGRMSPELQATTEVEDVVAEAWTRALPNLGSIRPNEMGRVTPPVVVYLCACVRNCILEAAKRMRREDPGLGGWRPAPPAAGFGAAGPEPVDPAPGPLRQVVREEARGQVMAALESLDQDDAELIERRAFRGDSPKGIAAELNLTANTVNIRYHRALKRLKERLPAGNVFEELELLSE